MFASFASIENHFHFEDLERDEFQKPEVLDIDVVYAPRKEGERLPAVMRNCCTVRHSDRPDECHNIALYSYGRLVAVRDGDCRLWLFTDGYNYEWSRTTMRHIVAFAHGQFPDRGIKSIKDVRRLAAGCVPAINGERVQYDDDKKAWTVVHA